jgi:hypothetical protein
MARQCPLLERRAHMCNKKIYEFWIFLNISFKSNGEMMFNSKTYIFILVFPFMAAEFKMAIKLQILLIYKTFFYFLNWNLYGSFSQKIKMAPKFNMVIFCQLFLETLTLDWNLKVLIFITFQARKLCAKNSLTYFTITLNIMY